MAPDDGGRPVASRDSHIVSCQTFVLVAADPLLVTVSNLDLRAGHGLRGRYDGTGYQIGERLWIDYELERLRVLFASFGYSSTAPSTSVTTMK